MPFSRIGRVRSIVVITIGCATASCSTSTVHRQAAPARPAAATHVAAAAHPCRVHVRGHRLTARVAYADDAFLPATGITPHTSAATARADILADPSSSFLGHRHWREIFAVFQNFKGRRPVWLLLERHVPGSSSLSSTIVKQDVIDMLDDRTRRPVAILEGLTDGCTAK